MKQSELDKVLVSVEREIARQNAELREAIGDDEALLEIWKRTLEFRPLARKRAVAPQRWTGALRA